MTTIFELRRQWKHHATIVRRVRRQSRYGRSKAPVKGVIFVPPELIGREVRLVVEVPKGAKQTVRKHQRP